MLKRPKRLLALALLISAVTLYWGCSQPDEVLTDITQTTIYLSPERLPSNPPGMVYNLCVAEGLVDDSVYNADCFAEFGYNFDQGRFKARHAHPDSADRADSNKFVLPADIMSYGYLFVSVQRTDGSDPGIGPVMLIDNITDPRDNPLDLVFPHISRHGDSLGIMYFNMKTVTNDTVIGLLGLDNDDSTNFRQEQALAGSAVWFSEVLYDVGVLQDTTSLCNWWIDTVGRTELDTNCQTSIVGASNFRDTVYEVGYGLDTLSHIAMIFDTATHEECMGNPTYWDPNVQESLYLTTHFEVIYWCDDSLCGGDSARANECDTLFSDRGFASPDSFSYHHFEYTGGSFTDLSSYGWRYEGWVVSPLIEDAQASIGDMTRPAWINYNTTADSAIRGIEGGLLSTGKFYGPVENEATNRMEFSWPSGGADEGNPYASNLHIPPPYPGEDFLNVPTTGGGVTAINLVPGNGRSNGTVFITVEPTNDVFDSTNFPLIVNSRELPSSRWQVEELTSTQAFAMIARNNVNSGVPSPVLIGMPRIRVTINRL